MSRALLITGATGHQGGAVIDALLSPSFRDFKILAVTRSSQTPRAQRLAAKSSSIKLVEGNLDAVPELFKSAKAAAGETPIWGVFSVQAIFGKSNEIKQGNDLIDEAIKNDVKHFVYSSVERGGNDKSWENPTPVPHFQSKHQIEHHLRDSTADGKSNMSWTVLRPVIFMDNVAPGFAGKVFMTALRDTMGNKPLQWIATADIGVFAAEAFEHPEAWNGKALGLAGDILTWEELNERFRKVTGNSVATTYGLLGKALKHGVKEVGSMIQWFKDEGCDADMEIGKKVHPEIMDMETWLKTKSSFMSKH